MENRFDRALNLINQAVQMLRGGSTSEREGITNETNNLLTASTSNNPGTDRTPTELSRLFPGFMRPSS